MKIIAILLIIAMLIVGMYEGDCTGAVLFAVLLAPAIFQRREGVKNERGERRCHTRSHTRTCLQKSFEKTC